MKVFNVIVRIIGLPFVLGLTLVRANFNALYITYMFIRHGGEWTSYRQDDKETIFKIYEKLRENNINLKEAVLKIDPNKLYPVTYTIDPYGNKVYNNTHLLGMDLTENQIEELLKKGLLS